MVMCVSNIKSAMVTFSCPHVGPEDNFWSHVRIKQTKVCKKALNNTYSSTIFAWRPVVCLCSAVGQNSRVLPRIVCVCGAVSVCGECHGVSNDVSYDVFFALCL